MIETTLANKGYVFFTKGVYNLNIIGVRHKGDKVTNHFDDCFVVIYNTDKEQNVKRIFSCTTLPGKKAMEHPMAVKGTAILKEGQYRGAYKVGYHKGKYKALCQVKPLPVYRDGNKDDKFDLNPLYIDNGIFGINIHKAGKLSQRVDTWSAGCQVFASETDFKCFMNYCILYVKINYLFQDSTTVYLVAI